jgi:hypothetical protein
MLAAGTLASFLEIQSDDPDNDDTVGATWGPLLRVQYG